MPRILPRGPFPATEPPPNATYHPAPGRVAQWESARFTRERSLVRNQPRPFPMGAGAGFFTPLASMLVRNQPRPSSVMGAGAGFFTPFALRAHWKPAAPIVRE